MNTSIEGKLIFNEDSKDNTIGGLMYVSPERCRQIADITTELAKKLFDESTAGAVTPNGVNMSINADGLIKDATAAVNPITVGEVLFLGISVGQVIVGLKRAGKKFAKNAVMKHRMANHPLAKLFAMMKEAKEETSSKPSQSADNSKPEAEDTSNTGNLED